MYATEKAMTPETVGPIKANNEEIHVTGPTRTEAQDAHITVPIEMLGKTSRAVVPRAGATAKGPNKFSSEP